MRILKLLLVLVVVMAAMLLLLPMLEDDADLLPSWMTGTWTIYLFFFLLFVGCSYLVISA